jgi:NAD(P)-dependent dehydrogenase (short-subunit alcohol dehydrogenase family)
MDHVGASLAGRRILITGAGGAYAGRGMGRVIATTLAQAGARLAAADIDLDAARATAAGITGRGGECVALQADVTSSRSVDAMVAAAAAALGGIDTVVNHAGLGNHDLLADTDDEMWRRILGINLDGPFFTTRRALPLMLAAGGGCVVNTISVCGLAGGRAGAAYTIAKHGLVGLTKNVAATYGRAGIRCNGVSPGRIRARTGDGTPADAPLSPIGPVAEVDEIFSRAGATSPDSGSPQEVAAAIAFLASDAASYINGAIIPVDGGWLAV